MELFLDRCQYFEHFFENVVTQKRSCLLNMIRERYLADREKKFSLSFVTFLPNKFKSYNQESLLQSFKTRKQISAKEAAAVLDLLSNFSSNETYLKTYQQDVGLFQYTVGMFSRFLIILTIMWSNDGFPSRFKYALVLVVCWGCFPEDTILGFIFLCILRP